MESIRELSRETLLAPSVISRPHDEHSPLAGIPKEVESRYTGRKSAERIFNFKRM
jgi:hypothetical protein